MKRQLIALLSLCILCFSRSYAQEENNTAPLWGLRAAVDFNIPGKWRGDGGSVKMYNSGMGVTMGGVCNLYLGNRFYLEPGVSLFYDSYSYDDITLTTEPAEVINPSIHKIGLRIPVVLGYTFSFSEKFMMSVYTGPELSYAFAGDLNFDNKEMDDDPELDLFNGQRRLDCAWKIGVGFPVNNWFIGIDAAIGMTDILKNDMKCNENRVSVSFTYFL